MSAPARRLTGRLAQAQTPAASRQCPVPVQPSAPVPYCETAHLRPAVLLGQCAGLEHNFQRLEQTSTMRGEHMSVHQTASIAAKLSLGDFARRPRTLWVRGLDHYALQHLIDRLRLCQEAQVPLSRRLPLPRARHSLSSTTTLPPQSAAAVRINTPSATGCLQASAPPSAPGPWYASA